MDNCIILGDLHIGSGQGSDIYLDQAERFFDGLCDYIQKNNVKHLIILGDLFDNRRNIDFKVLARSYKFFTERFAYNEDINVYVIVGNHDSYLKNTIDLNSPSLLLSWSKIQVIQEPTEIEINDKKILLVPWICKENSDKLLSSITNSTANICCGHFDIQGFTMVKGFSSVEGLSSSIFNSFETVYSGHFHIGSSSGNIIYVGSPYQLSFNDVGDTKRFICTDFTKPLTIDNVITELSEELFFNIHWTEKYTRTDFKGKIVKVFIGSHTPEEAVAYFVWWQSVLASEPASFVVDTLSKPDSISTVNVDISKDTREILSDYIDETIEEDESFRKDVRALVFDLYEEAYRI